MVNTKIIMTASGLLLGLSGLALTFMPDSLQQVLQLHAGKTGLLLLQVLGGLYFGFAMLNWMAKSSRIGGIYNRPIAIANFSHFLIAGLALLKGVWAQPDLPRILWVAAIAYLIFGLFFGGMLFGEPVLKSDNSQ